MKRLGRTEWSTLAREHLHEIYAATAEIEAGRLIERIEEACENPIEKLLAAAFAFPPDFNLLPNFPMLSFAMSGASSLEDLELCLLDRLEEAQKEPLRSGLDPGGWVGLIRPQVTIGPYRVDFGLVAALLPHDRNWADRPSLLKIAIECDGHDFHERTKQQAAHDRAKDRFLQGEGLTVLRFTGSEIWAGPNKCGWQVLDHIRQWHARLPTGNREAAHG